MHSQSTPRKYRTALAGGTASVLAAIAIAAPAGATVPDSPERMSVPDSPERMIVPVSPDRTNIPDNVLPAVQDDAPPVVLAPPRSVRAQDFHFDGRGG